MFCNSAHHKIRGFHESSVLSLHLVRRYFKFGNLVNIGNMKQLGTIRITQYTVYSVRWGTYFLVIRVEHQKLNQTTAELSFG